MKSLSNLISVSIGPI